MERYVLSYEGRNYSFESDKEMKKYLEQSGINKKVNEYNSNMMMVYNYVGKVATIKIIKKYC